MDAQTQALMREIANEAAVAAVAQTLTSLGVDQRHPISVQKDMAALRELRELIEDPETQADLMHLRKWRKTMERVQSKGILTLVGLLITGACAAVWIGLQTKFGS